MARRPKVFISYRRADAAYVANAIHDALERAVGRGSTFFDVDAIPPGHDFVQRIEDTLRDSDVVLAVIGEHWNAPREDGVRPLDDTSDFVRQELERAIEHDLPVIPVLTGAAVMPATEQLPASLQALSRRQAVELRAGRDFRHHLAQLVHAVKQTPRRDSRAARGFTSAGSKTLVRVALVAAIALVLAYPIVIHDRLQTGQAVRVNRAVKLRPAPGTNPMPGTVTVEPGQTATYVERTFRRYLLIREGGTYFDYWRKVRTEDGRDGWIYGRYLDPVESDGR